LAPAEPHARRVDIRGAGGQHGTGGARKHRSALGIGTREEQIGRRLRRGRFCVYQTKEREILFVSDKGERDFGSFIILRGEGYLWMQSRIIILKKKKVDAAPTTERAV
jgi:hypothetical protein